jgi:hypothetical protein
MRDIVGIKTFSAWMIIISALIMTLIVHPSLLSYLMVGLNVGLMILQRELATAEHRPICYPCIAAGVLMVAGVMFAMFKIHWLAI